MTMTTSTVQSYAYSSLKMNEIKVLLTEQTIYRLVDICPVLCDFVVLFLNILVFSFLLIPG